MARRLSRGTSLARLIRPNSGLICSVAVSMIVIAAAQSGWMSYLSTARNIAVTALGIGFIIFVHEAGHFLVAKACGVKCEKFYLGFDVYGLYLAKYRWGETEYGIGALPLGGYVKMLGQDDNVANAEGENERTKIRNADGTVTLDPRSYTAKSVPQRMAIISAGVIMNLIFAVIFASVAFTQGVDYVPCVVGSLSGGGAAWEAGIEPGDRILQFGRNGTPSKHLRYFSDLMEKVYFHDPSTDLDLLIEKPNGEQQWITTRPKRRFDHMTIFGADYRGRLGVGQPESLRLMAPTEDSVKKLPSDKQWIAGINKNDLVIAVNGTAVKSNAEFVRVAIQSPDKPLKLTVERTFDAEGNKLEAAVQAELVAPPMKENSLGIYFRAGAVSHVKKDSVAAAAGIEEQDQIVEVNGKRIEDPFSLPGLFARLAGKETEITIERTRKSARRTKVTLTPAPVQHDLAFSIGTEIGIDGIGVSFPLELAVSGISEQVVSQQLDIKEGDKVVAFRLESEGKDGKPDLADWYRLEPKQADGALVSSLATNPAVKALHLQLARDDKKIEVRVVPVQSDAHALMRDIPFEPVIEVRQTDSLTEALQLGLRETRESMYKVVTFLKKLVSLEVSPTKLGGPLTIAYVANSEASQSIPRFLIFLTLISANLAIVNFLPIPVLDGGHMMFLTAEAIRGKPVSEAFQIKLTILGFMFVMGLMLFVISLDVLRFSGVDVS